MALAPLTKFYILVGVSSASTALTLFFTAYLFFEYFRSWTQPRTQALVMRVILIVPVWGILGLINVVLPDVRYITTIFLDLYEAFAILSFMQLIYHYLGGKEQAQWKASGKNPYRCCGFGCFLYPGEKAMKIYHVMIYQFAFLRPLIAIIECVRHYKVLVGEDETGKDWVALGLTALVLSSLIVAMWALLQVYRTFSLILQPNNIGSKFMAIKVYIFLHAVQGFVFGAMANRQETPQQAQGIVRIEYTIFCFEMFIGALLNKYAFFNAKEYFDHDGEEERIRLETSKLNNKTRSDIYFSQNYTPETETESAPLIVQIDRS